MYEDKTLTCRECGNEFVFSASEQEFFAQKGFQNEPSRCPACRAARRAQNAAAARPRFLSSPAEIVPCTAVSASKHSARPGSDSYDFSKAGCRQGSLLFLSLFPRGEHGQPHRARTAVSIRSSSFSAAAWFSPRAKRYAFSFGSVPEGRTTNFSSPDRKNSSTSLFGRPVSSSR